MSIKVIALLLDRKFGSTIKKMIAVKLADCADDQGSNVYPAIDTIARQAEVSRRSVNNALREFEAAGILVCEKRGGSGPKATHRYRFDLDVLAALPSTNDDGEKGANAAPLEEKGCNWRHEKGATGAPNPSLEPSEEKESSNEDSQKAAASEIRSAFDEYNLLAERIGLPSAKILTDKRRSGLKARLSECGGLAGWRDALARVEASPFLTGKVKDFKADLDFLLQPSSFAKLIEGKYDDKPNGQGPPGMSERERMWRGYLSAYFANGTWLPQWPGGPPDGPNSAAPPRLVAEYRAKHEQLNRAL